MQSLRGKRTPRERARRLPAPLPRLEGPPPDQSYLPLGRSASQLLLRGEGVAMMSFISQPQAVAEVILTALAAVPQREEEA